MRWRRGSCDTHLYYYMNPATAGSISDLTSGGTFYNGYESASFTCGEVDSMQANPASGYAFSSWQLYNCGSLSSTSSNPTSYTACDNNGAFGDLYANFVGSPLDLLATDNSNNPGGSYTSASPPSWSQSSASAIESGLKTEGYFSTEPAFGYGEPVSQTNVQYGTVNGYNIVDVMYLQVGGSQIFGPVPGNVTLSITLIQQSTAKFPQYNMTMYANFIPSSSAIYNAGEVPKLNYQGNFADEMNNYSEVLHSIFLNYEQSSNTTINNIGTDYAYVSNAVAAFVYYVLGTGPFYDVAGYSLGDVTVLSGTASAVGIYQRTYQCIALAAIDFAHTVVEGALFPPDAEGEVLVQSFGGAILLDGVEAAVCQ